MHFVVAALLSLLSLLPARSGVKGQEWELKYEEDFTTPLQDSNAGWTLEDYSTPFDTILEDNGLFYQNDYGPAFLEALDSFQTYRKEFTIGKDGWLTASLSARDWNKDGVIEREPSMTIVESAEGRQAIQIDASEDHTGGAILRNTFPLSEQYRIEYKLMTFDFGGKRGGTFEYDGKINGFKEEGPVYPCKTQHPWGEGSASSGWEGSADAAYCDWQSIQEGVYGYNGFSFLTIADFLDPAPRNNHFWHSRRKLLIDAFAQSPDRVGDEAGGQVCNSATNEYYNYSDSSFNVVNMWISGLPGTFTPSPGGLYGSSQLFMSTCNGGIATRGLQSAVELQPELMPNEYYTFAVERNTTGYTMEVSGNFARSGFQEIRLYRPFEVDGEPIWHYNVKPEEYDGGHNADLKQENWAFGSAEWPDQWPAGSAFPDSFVIGDLYTNAYEGIATLTDIRYFEAKASCERAVFMTTADTIQSGERLIHSTANLYLDLHLNANLQLWKGTPDEPEMLIWESMVNQSTNVTYFTELQEDGNLVTYGMNASSRSIVWMTDAVGPIDGTVYSLALDCNQNGGNLGIFVGPPQASNESLWTGIAYTGPPSPQPTMSPLVSDPAVPTSSCVPTVMMKSGEFLYPGKRVIDYDKGVHLIQLENGNVEIRKGSPEVPGDLMWESGYIGSTEHSYYTKFEANSNLITWKTLEDHSFSAVWETGTYRPTLIPFYLTVDCSEMENRISIYEGHPNENGLLVWTVDSKSQTDPIPFPKPTDPPTDAPSGIESSEPTNGMETSEPTNGMESSEPTDQSTAFPSRGCSLRWSVMAVGLLYVVV